MSEAKSNGTGRLLIWLCVLAIVLAGITVGVVVLAYKPARKLIATLSKPNFAAITPIDLTKFYDNSASWNSPGAWEVVPHGSNVLGGVPFQANGLLRLTGLAAEKSNSKYRERADGI